MSHYNKMEVIELRRILYFILIIISFIFVCGIKPEKEPDVVNSISLNRDYRLTVIANRNKIKDKVEFAEELIQMCRENSFKTIKFSTDFGYATEIRMTVYLSKADWKKGKAAMEISYIQDSLVKEYDIVNNPEKFEMTIK